MMLFKRLEIPLTSKCNCCFQHSEENFQHLSINNEFVATVRCYFLNNSRINLNILNATLVNGRNSLLGGTQPMRHIKSNYWKVCYRICYVGKHGKWHALLDTPTINYLLLLSSSWSFKCSKGPRHSFNPKSGFLLRIRVYNNSSKLGIQSKESNHYSNI